MKFTKIAAALSLAVTLGPPAGAETFLKMDTGSPGSATHTVSTYVSNVAHKYVDGMTIQLTAGQPATKASVKGGEGKVDFFVYAPSINAWMDKGERMFKTLDTHKKLHDNLRAVTAFPAGAYQFIVYEDSGIRTFADLRGKKVFVGPKNSAANALAKSVIQAASGGLVAGQDYEAVELDWGSAGNAFQDRQVVNFMRPTSIPDAFMAQIALTNKVRLLGIDDDAMKNPLIEKELNEPGRSLETIPANTYGDNQMNKEPVKAIGVWVGVGAGVHVDADSVYQVTKAFWEHIDELHASAAWTKIINLDTAFTKMNIPLHEGAYRYYKEIGVDVPADVVPVSN